jgi:hypothetical protein
VHRFPVLRWYQSLAVAKPCLEEIVLPTVWRQLTTLGTN